MASIGSLQGDLTVQGNLTVTGEYRPAIARTALLQESLSPFPVRMTDWKVWDAMQTNLPTTPATDDLGMVHGTFATGSPSLQTEDLKAEAGNPTLKYARAQIPLPMNYVAGQTVVLRIHCGMITTAADDTCTIDVSAYESDGEAGISADLCATAAVSMNSTDFADKDFTITATTLNPGDMLDVRVLITVSDGATGTAVIGCIGAVTLLCDTKG